MSLVLQPQAAFTVVRQIANHLDTDTLYVRAVIRNAYTDAIIETIDLTDKGDQRFKLNWHVPADPSGQGFYISIVTSVYTDENYTSKSPNYGDEENTYLIQERVLGSLKSGAGGITADQTRQIIESSIAKIKFPKQKEGIFKQIKYDLHFRKIDRALKALSKSVGAIPTKEFKEVDLRPIIKAIGDKPVTPEADFTILNTNIEDIKDKLREADSIREDNRVEIKNKVGLFEKEFVEKISKELKSFSFSVEPMNAKITKPGEKKEEFNIKKLAS